MLVTKTIHINMPPERLWPVLVEAAHIERWMPSLVSDEPISTGPTRVGYQSKMKIREGKNVVAYTSEITVYEPVSHLAMRLTGGNLGEGPMQVHYRLTPQEGGTQLKYESHWTAHGLLLKLMSPLIGLMSRFNANEEMKRLKAYAEGLE